MNSHYHTLFSTIILLLLQYSVANAQTPSFYHLTTANGLYDNHVRSLALDRNGFLWIGTEEGLNLYDGHSVSVFTKDKYPALPSDRITRLYCDPQGRTWVGAPTGAAYIDARKTIHRIVLRDSIPDFATKAIIETNKQGIILITSKGQFHFDAARKSWQLITEATDLLPYEKIRAVQPFDGDKIVFATDSSLWLYDYAQSRLIKMNAVPGVLSMCRLKSGELACGTKSGEVILINAVTGQITHRYLLGNITGTHTATPQPVDMKQADNGTIVIATGFTGVITISPAGNISRFVHEPVNPVSIIDNSSYRIVTGTNGEVVIGSAASGVSMYNTRLNQASFKGFFSDATGSYYDNYTGPMLETNEQVIWIGTYDRLIRWDKKNNGCRFYYYVEKEGTFVKRGDIRAICRDKTGRLWVSIDEKGIASFSEKTGIFKKLVLNSELANLFGRGTTRDLVMDETGLIWACSNNGIYTIDPVTGEAALPADPVLETLSGKTVHAAFEDDQKQLWFTTAADGVYRFDKRQNRLTRFTTKEGLPSDTTYMVREDKKHRYFISTAKGIAIVRQDKVIHTFDRKRGLRYDRCESVLIDKEDIAWFSNRECLVRLNVDHNSIKIFGERSGLLNNGFRVGSCLTTESGELLWGGLHGVSYFKPDDLKNTVLPVQATIHQVQAQDSIMDILQVPLRIPYAKSSITFRFAGLHLGIPGNTWYRYRLQGFDNNWQNGGDVQQARYTALPPGTYTFELKASLDGVHWVDAERKIDLVIVPPIWMHWRFIGLVALLVAAIVYWLVRTHSKKIRKQKEEWEAEQAINYFAGTLHEQQTVESILWDVARNCIGRLQFEDCVVYLLDDEKNTLVQKAAYGPKSPKNFQISEPLEIPVGKGIVGSVAVSGKAELIHDTVKDSRYIIDDRQRRSEITVPILFDGKVIGVIDCEHSKKRFFTQKHLSILVTIASLCANKIIRAKAEEEKLKAQAILIDTKQKMAEVEMRALRAQMNPHFIFNCLNSINRYIVKSDQATASLYLTRFAKLIRLILDNSGSKKVLLSNELEALKLYMEMESLRFDKKFTYRIVVDPYVNTDSIELPPLIIQPYVENAIWHGLLHKEGGGQLSITITLIDEGMLECTIEDNGVGRNKAKELKSKSATSRKSMGMQLTENRLSLLNQHAGLHASITIIDMENESKQPAGTKVIVRIPV